MNQYGIVLCIGVLVSTLFAFESDDVSNKVEGTRSLMVNGTALARCDNGSVLALGEIWKSTDLWIMKVDSLSQFKWEMTYEVAHPHTADDFVIHTVAVETIEDMYVLSFEILGEGSNYARTISVDTGSGELLGQSYILAPTTEQGEHTLFDDSWCLGMMGMRDTLQFENGYTLGMWQFQRGDGKGNHNTCTLTGIFRTTEESVGVISATETELSANYTHYNSSTQTLQFTEAEVRTVQLFDVRGRVLISEAFDGISFSFPQLAAGIYLWRVVENGISQSATFSVL